MKVTTVLAILTIVATATGAARQRARLALPEPVVDADYYENGKPSAAKVELGRLLFFDKILSGNQNISCATCHHPELATSDGLALPLGEGPTGLGPQRRAGTTPETAIHERVPRNSPALFNLGAREFTRMFHDGRVEVDEHGYYEGGFITPAKWKLPPGLENVLAAQAMFPVTSPAEMAGQKGENPLADMRSLNNVAGPGGVWEQIAGRLAENPEYVRRFCEAFPEEIHGGGDITFVHAANAIAAFETVAFRADNSPFDRTLRGEEGALAPAARRGMELFYGRAGCASCHSGKFQTDHGFHAIAMPQIGPGKADGNDGDYWRETGVRAFVEDFGRGRVTVRPEDNYKFRTPSLRNVALTGPWGHAGSFDRLEDVVRHHLDATASLERYRADTSKLPRVDRVLELRAAGSRLTEEWLEGNRLAAFHRRDTFVQEDAELRRAIAAANELPPVRLTDDEMADLLAFLESLTDPASRDLTRWTPDRVPSGLPVED